MSKSNKKSLFFLILHYLVLISFSKLFTLDLIEVLYSCVNPHGFYLSFEDPSDAILESQKQ